MQFRKLRADEIDCRIAQIGQKGLSLLLYQNARVAMDLLDETVGADNWQRKHEVINGNLFCSIGIRVTHADGSSEWIWKQDVGVESYTEKEKGESSDSFKRASVNIGIARELYTAPFIFVKANLTNITNDNGKYKCYDRFKVREIGYDELGNINRLVIVNQSGEPVYEIGKPKPEKSLLQTVYDMAKNGLFKPEEMCEYFQVKSLEDLNAQQLNIIIEGAKVRGKGK